MADSRGSPSAWPDLLQGAHVVLAIIEWLDLVDTEAELPRIETTSGGRMARFSQRYGYVPTHLELQIGSMDRALRIALWNWFVANIIRYAYGGILDQREALREVWAGVLLRPLDEMPDHLGPGQDAFKPYFLNGDWHVVVDVVELAAQLCPQSADDINPILEANLAGYRFVGGEMAEITDSTQVQAINEAVEPADDGLNSARKHLSRAVELFSERPKPDYRNTVKEAISAAESAACVATGKADFNAAVKKMVRDGTMHPALQRSMSALFGYTSDEQGVRHGFTTEDERVDYPEALFVLVTCSAFLTYVAEHANRHKVQHAIPTDS